ncbi:MAG: hypothetical protein LBC61_07730 [Candidatus Peribacteria bacterium]|nr:hypothetical protein [Candidatus Peribacteria bacterium]
MSFGLTTIVFLLTFQILLYPYITLASPSVSTEIISQSALYVVVVFFVVSPSI